MSNKTCCAEEDQAQGDRVCDTPEVRFPPLGAVPSTMCLVAAMENRSPPGTRRPMSIVNCLSVERKSQLFLPITASPRLTIAVGASEVFARSCSTPADTDGRQHRF